MGCWDGCERTLGGDKPGASDQCIDRVAHDTSAGNRSINATAWGASAFRAAISVNRPDHSSPRTGHMDLGAQTTARAPKLDLQAAFESIHSRKGHRGPYQFLEQIAMPEQ